jgi:hypothetical protein
MAKRQRNFFIENDRKFIDNYYYYCKFKKYANSDKKKSSENIQKALKNSCDHYLSAINRCLNKITTANDLNERLDYLDFIRWNQLLIDTQLDEYQENAQLVGSVAYLKNAISLLKNSMSSIMQKYFKLSHTEKGICNEYIHAFQIAFVNNKGLTNTNGSKKSTFYIHTGRLFINYLNILAKNYYVEKLDRDNITFEDLEEEAYLLIFKLIDIDEYKCRRIIMDIKSVLKAYEDFRKLDAEFRVAQDVVIAGALELAHKRATENALDRTIRVFHEKIVSLICFPF